MTDFDLTGDGYVDTHAYDMNHDGINDTLYVDANQDGLVDLVAVDADEDGTYEQSFLDANHDGIDDRANPWTSQTGTWMSSNGFGEPADTDYSTLGDINHSPEAGYTLHLGPAEIADQAHTTLSPNDG